MWGRVSVGGVVVCLLVPGCWSSESRVDGAFSQEEWAFLQTFKLPEPELCPEGFVGDRCDAAVRLGKHLFFDPEISGPITHDLAQCLSYQGAYVLVDRRINTWLTPYIRIDWRDAVLEKGADFVHESHTLRTTLGVHLEITSRVVGKIEYVWIRELGVPQFPHDVITSSIVVSTD